MKKLASLGIQCALFLLPWSLRRVFLCYLFNFKIEKTAKIGYSLIDSWKLEMGANSRIGHLSIFKGLHLVILEPKASIGNLNWFFAFPLTTKSSHFSDQLDRRPVLHMCKESAITNRHIIDCTDFVHIGEFSTIAGFRSQLLTHSINLSESRQRSAPIQIGNFCFIGSGCILLPGSKIPNYSVLGAGSVLTKAFNQDYSLYSGIPAKLVKPIDPTYNYFHRKIGYVI